MADSLLDSLRTLDVNALDAHIASLSEVELAKLEQRIEREKSGPSIFERIGGAVQGIGDVDKRTEAAENFNFMRPLVRTAQAAQAVLPLPGDASKTPTEKMDKLKNQANMATGLARIGMGAVDDVAATLTPNKSLISPNQELFQDAVHESTKRLTDVDEFVKEPDQAAFDFFSFLPGPGSLGRGPGVIRAMGRAALGDPSVAIKVADKALSVPKGLSRVAQEATALGTGRGPETMGLARRAGKLGETESLRAGQALADETRLGSRIIKNLTNEKRKLGAAKGEAVKNKSVNIADLKEAVVGDIESGGLGGVLADMDIGVSVNPHAGKNLFKTGGFSSRIELDVPVDVKHSDEGLLVKELEKLVNRDDIIPVEKLSDILESVDGMKPTSTRGKRIKLQLRKTIRDKLGQVPGIDKAMKDLRRQHLLLDDVSDRLSGAQLTDIIDDPASPTSLTQKLSSSLDDTELPGAKLKGIERLDRQTPGINVRSELAGVRTARLAPTSLVGRSEFYRILLGGAGLSIAGGAAEANLILGILSIPVLASGFSPKYAARHMARLGKLEGKAEHVRKVSQHLVEQAERLNINVPKTMSIGQLIERMPDDNEEKKSLVGQIGTSR